MFDKLFFFFVECDKFSLGVMQTAGYNCLIRTEIKFTRQPLVWTQTTNLIEIRPAFADVKHVDYVTY
jgi:hypothetical protein